MDQAEGKASPKLIDPTGAVLLAVMVQVVAPQLGQD